MLLRLGCEPSDMFSRAAFASAGRTTSPPFAANRSTWIYPAPVADAPRSSETNRNASIPLPPTFRFLLLPASRTCRRRPNVRRPWDGEIFLVTRARQPGRNSPPVPPMARPARTKPRCVPSPPRLRQNWAPSCCPFRANRFFAPSSALLRYPRRRYPRNPLFVGAT